VYCSPTALACSRVPMPVILSSNVLIISFSLPAFQTVSINKAINTQEVAVKEKAPCILGTHHEKGAQTFWSVVNRLPLSSNAVLCWKFCHVFHKLLRDGHSSVLQDSMRYKGELSDMSRMWGHLSEGYGRLSSIYLKLLITKMEFHSKNPRFPGNLQMTDRQLEETGENDVNNFFQLTVEMFDYLECELSLFQDVPMVGEVGGELLGGCWTLCFLLFCWMLFSLSLPGLPADTLQGHRDRFHEQFRKLKELLYRSSNLQYFKRLIQIPQLPESPPNFLRASALSEHVSPVVVIPAESGSPDTEPVAETEDLVEMDSSSQQVQRPLGGRGGSLYSHRGIIQSCYPLSPPPRRVCVFVSLQCPEHHLTHVEG
uniref:ENTH domain-containing protein n=1 Tax=Callorhinchus milii TaxID=7868 RepID=A0A4W3IDL0_CALMI